MEWTNNHSSVLAETMSGLLGNPTDGSMAFVRCFAPEIVKHLATDNEGFVVAGWKVVRVAAETDVERRTITADEAVELRESKDTAALILVDTAEAGAGMDGIWSSARELSEQYVLQRAYRIALAQLGSRQQEYVKEALKQARAGGARNRLSPWGRLDFVCRVLGSRRRPGAQLHLIGLWPVNDDGRSPEDAVSDLGESRRFVDRLLGPGAVALSRSERVQSLRLVGETLPQRRHLERYLRTNETLPVIDAVRGLKNRRRLWVNSLKTERSVDNLLAIELVRWRGKTGKLLKWSGLKAGMDDLPQLVLPWEADTDDLKASIRLEVRWKARPRHLEKGAADYRVQVLTNGTDSEVAGHDVPHTAKTHEKVVFGLEDFSEVEEGAVLPVRVVVSAVSAIDSDDDSTPFRVPSEEFQIVFGHLEGSQAATGETVRTFSEAVVELRSREAVTRMISLEATRPVEAKGGFLTWRSPDERKRYRVYRAPLIKEIEEIWRAHENSMGRWRVRVRMSGERIGSPEFIPLERHGSVKKAIWNRALGASRRIATEVFADIGGAGQLYDQNMPRYKNIVTEYLRSWIALLRIGKPDLALAQTVEVRSQAGSLLGLIVLPAHPLRMAWHAAYDNLLLHAVLREGLEPGEVRNEMKNLDGAAFPAFLPGTERGRSFVFGDMLGFHAVGMVVDNDEEPKGSLAVLNRAMGGSEEGPVVPAMTGSESVAVLANEVCKYLHSHRATRILHVHALRAGDGATVVRALGDASRMDANKRSQQQTPPAPTDARSGLAYVLELYPSRQERRRGIAGRFISEAQEKRRRGSGTVEQRDRWMLQSTERPGGTIIPNLRWARKETMDPDSAAHVAFAFDTFDAQVQHRPAGVKRPFHAYGLMSFFDRRYYTQPIPRWEATVPYWQRGELHPAARAHSERLKKLQVSIHRLVATNLGGNEATTPVLSTEVSPDAADGLNRIHDLCDWVITLDRNVGLEYFDSPQQDRETFDKFVIDCVPERDDLGCLRLITSTANLEEVQELLGEGLDSMGLSHSRRSAEMLIESLKALSGRLAIRLTGGRGPASELVALALSQMNCARMRRENGSDSCWTSLREGFLVPVDDIQDLLPPEMLSRQSGRGRDQRGARPDLVHVRISDQGGLSFQFIEVKYRRHLRASRSPQLIRAIRDQTQSLQKRWFAWYGETAGSRSLRAIRRARLARLLHFYAAKAHRHGLPARQYDALLQQIDQMVERSTTYPIKPASRGNRGWVFCPEYRGTPIQISPEDWTDVRIFLFGPASLPDIGPGFEAENGDTDPYRDRGTDVESAGTRTDDYEETLELGLVESRPSTSEAATKSGHHKRRIPETQQSSVSREAPPIHDGESKSNMTEVGIRTAPLQSPQLLLGVDRFDNETRWPLTTKGNPHLLIGGLPGMGKTTCLLNLCKQMMEVDVYPIVFSYHQDIDERLESLGTAGRGEPLRFIDFDGLGFNPLQVFDRSSSFAHLDVAGTIRDIFMAIYPELGALQGGEIREAVKESFQELGWGASSASLDALDEPPFRRFLQILREKPKPGIGLKNLLSRLDELDDYGFFHLKHSHGSLWDSDRPTVIRIHRTKSDVLQTAFSSLVLYGLYKNMFQRGVSSTITHAIVVDEAHRAARLRLVPTMAKECRKFGVSLILASQEARDFHRSVFSAIANYLVLRMTETDAKTLVKNVASSEHQRTLVDRIKQMDRFKAFYFSSDGTRPTLLNLPDFSPNK